MNKGEATILHCDWLNVAYPLIRAELRLIPRIRVQEISQACFWQFPNLHERTTMLPEFHSRNI